MWMFGTAKAAAKSATFAKLYAQLSGTATASARGVASGAWYIANGAGRSLKRSVRRLRILPKDRS